MKPAQPAPWTLTTGREIADAAGNVVQYTEANLGTICLAINTISRLLPLISEIEEALPEPLAQRLRDALSRAPLEGLAAECEALNDQSTELNRKISHNLIVPELNFTGSFDAAYQLKPDTATFELSQIVNSDTGQLKHKALVKVEDKIFIGIGTTMPLALTAASLRAWSAK